MERCWISSLIVLVASVHFGSCMVPAICPGTVNGTACYFSNVATLQPTLPRYFAVGGLFNIHKRGQSAYSCGAMFNGDELMLSQAFLWALNYWQGQINNNEVSVGGVVFDSCEREDQMVQNLLGFEQCNLRIRNIDRHNLVGFVGTNNMDAMAAASLTADMHLPLISPLADSLSLSDRGKYPYFQSTVPDLQIDINIMAGVLEHVGTKYVAAIYEQSEKNTFDAFKRTMEAKNICVTDSLPMSGDEPDSQIQEYVVTLEKIRFIALFLSPEMTLKFVKQVKGDSTARNMNLVFLLPSSIRKDSPVFDGSYTVSLSDAIILERKPAASMQTAVNLFKTNWQQTMDGTAMPNAQIHNPYLAQYRNMTSPAQRPTDHWALGYTIMAAKAFVDGTRQAGADICQNNNKNYLCTSFFDQENRGTKLNDTISRFLSNAMGSNVGYAVYSYQQTGAWLNVGTYANNALSMTVQIKTMGAYRPGQCPDPPCLLCGELPTTTTTTTPAPTTTEKCVREPEGNFSIVYYPPDQEITGAYMESKRMDSEFATRFEVGQRWIIALGVLAGLGILAVIVFEIYILYKLLGTRMGQKWRTMWLGQLLLFGILLCYLTLFAYLPIPTKATCGITRFGVGVSYSICFAVLLVKLMVILTSKTSENSLLPGDVESPNYLKGVYQFLMFVFVVGVQVVIDAQWLITVPPEAVKVTGNHGEDVWICNHYTFKASGSMTAMTDMSSFVRNEFENHLLSLVYIMFLIIITTILALNAHGIITNHRESVFIGIAAGFSIPIWLAWGLVGGLNKDNDYAHEFGDACIAFGLFLTATLILFAMFLPKVRQLVSMGVEGIYFEDDRDTVYAGSVIMAPPSYKSRPNSVIYVNNQGIYSEPMVVGNGDTSTYLRHQGSSNPTPASTYSAPPTYLKKGGDSTIRSGNVLRVTDDLSGRRPLEKRRPMSEVAYGTASRPRSVRGTLPRSRSHTNLGAL